MADDKQSDFVVKVTIKIKDVEVSLTLDELKKLRQEIDKIIAAPADDSFLKELAKRLLEKRTTPPLPHIPLPEPTPWRPLPLTPYPDPWQYPRPFAPFYGPTIICEARTLT